MRYYKIEISRNGAKIAELKLDEKNSNALAIKFNIQAYFNSGTYSPSTLTIMNPATSFYSSSEGLIGMDIILTAGIKPSVFTQKLGLTPSTNDVLFIGKIARAVPQYSGLNPSVTLLLSTTIMDNTDEKGKVLIIEQGQKIADSLKKTLNELLPYANIIIADNALSMTLQSKQTFQQEVKNFSLFGSIANSLGIGVAVEKNSIVLYSKKDGLEVNKLFIPQGQDFLSQPEWQNHSTIQCVFGLRGDINLGQSVQMPPNLITNTGSLIQDTGSLAGVSNANALIAKGKYRITGIWHTGDSHNPSALSWATTISATSSINLANKGI